MIGVGLSVGVLLFAAVIIIILKSLPSTSELRMHYFSARLHKPIAVAPAAPTVPFTGGVANDPQTVSGATSAPAPAPPPAPTAAPVTTTLADYAADRFVGQGDRTLNVCDELQNLSALAPIDRASFTQAIQQQVNGTDNPFANAALAPLAALLQIPNVGSVVAQIRDAQDESDPGLVHQAQFYTTVALAASDVYSNRATLDAVSDHAYHLSVMARLASYVPASANDSTFQNLCDAVEARVITPGTTAAQDNAAEKSALVQLIGAAGLTPSQVGFDPQMNTHLSVGITPEAVTVSSPWMNQMFGSGLQLNARSQ